MASASQPVEHFYHAQTLATDKHIKFYPNKFSSFGCLWQLAMIVLFGLFTSYPSTPLDRKGENNYPMFQDTHIMMVIGFGFLYTLLKRYAWTGVAYNYIITVYVLQWAILCQGFWVIIMNYRKSQEYSGAWDTPIPLTIDALINADYVVATVLVSFGAVIGRFSAMQCLVMAFVETVCATANVIISFEFKVYDAGGSMLIHTFGAAFGLACAYAYGDKAVKGKGLGESRLGTTRHNGTFAMIGTMFLFAFWPSFNGALLKGDGQTRAVVNTVLAICASAVASFMVSKSVHHGKIFDMEHVQNATLAGGVAIGAACDMLMNPWGAMLTGFVAGCVSAYGFTFLGPFLKKRVGLTDTCGIASLHGMPGLIGGVAGAIAMGVMGEKKTEWNNHLAEEEFAGRIGRSALMQGSYQMAMAVISLGFGLLSGYLTGKFLKLEICDPVHTNFYEDAGAWEVPEDPSDAEYLEKTKGEDIESAMPSKNVVSVLADNLKAAGAPTPVTAMASPDNEATGTVMVPHVRVVAVPPAATKPAHQTQPTATSEVSVAPAAVAVKTLAPVEQETPLPSPPDGATLLKNAGLHSTHLGDALDVHMQLHGALMKERV